MKYSEVYSKLCYESATVVFLKKDGTIRTMLATRNLHTAKLEYGFLGGALGGRDTKCNINNGNLAVIDLLIGEPRTFNIERLLSIDYYGIIDSKDKLNQAAEKHLEFKKKYDSTLEIEE